MILVKTDGTKVTDWTTLDKDGLKKIAAKYDDMSIPYWYINTIGGGTVIYIFETGSTTTDEVVPVPTKNTLVVETKRVPTDEDPDRTDIRDADTAIIKAVAAVKEKITDEDLLAAVVKSITFEWDDYAKDAHGFTVTGEDHNAIYDDEFEFGDSDQCNMNDWNTAVTLNKDFPNYKRVVGNLASKQYAPHGEDGSECTMIKAVTVAIPEAFQTIVFPSVTVAEDKTVTINGTQCKDETDTLIPNTYYVDTCYQINFDDAEIRNGGLQKDNYSFALTFRVIGVLDPITNEFSDFELEFSYDANQIVNKSAPGVQATVTVK